jgi:mono/diheme cytochrome c family protein
MKSGKSAKPGRHAILWFVAAVWVLGSMLAASNAQSQNPERGRLLYENHCGQCHTEQIHGRSKRIARTPEELREIVRRWQAQQHLNWGDEEIDDVAHYLGTMRYGFE